MKKTKRFFILWWQGSLALLRCFIWKISQTKRLKIDGKRRSRKKTDGEQSWSMFCDRGWPGDVDREIVQLESTMAPHRSHRSILGQTITHWQCPEQKRLYGSHIWVLYCIRNTMPMPKQSLGFYFYRQRFRTESTEIKTQIPRRKKIRIF